MGKGHRFPRWRKQLNGGMGSPWARLFISNRRASVGLDCTLEEMATRHSRTRTGPNSRDIRRAPQAPPPTTFASPIPSAEQSDSVEAGGHFWASRRRRRRAKSHADTCRGVMGLEKDIWINIDISSAPWRVSAGLTGTPLTKIQQ